VKPLTPADLDWLESRIETHGITKEDRRRLLSDLRAARKDAAYWHTRWEEVPE